MSGQICIDPQHNDGPRTLRDPRERERRNAMLTMPHVAPLVHYTAGLRERDGVEVPEFDPLDGGVDAKYLFLFEKPGPMTAAAGRRAGSGFISRNNDDPTAEATFNFMRQAGIPRRATVIWNIVPWWNGTRKIIADEIRDGAASFVSLRGYLSKLSAVVMVGEKAARLQPYLKSTGLELFQTCHPSPLVRARFRSRWEAIPSEWSKVLAVGSRHEVK
jgi:hypothetical protein